MIDGCNIYLDARRAGQTYPLGLGLGYMWGASWGSWARGQSNKEVYCFLAPDLRPPPPPSPTRISLLNTFLLCTTDDPVVFGWPMAVDGQVLMLDGYVVV